MKLTVRRVWIPIAIALAAATVVLVARKNPAESSHWWLFATQPLGVTLLSNREVAGLEFAYYALSNRTGRPVSYLRDRNADEPCYSLIEHLTQDPSTGTIRVTNHNEARFRYIAPADLAPHTSVPFTVRYPSEVTNGVISVSYWPTRSRFQSFVYDLTQRAFGKTPLPTNSYERIQIPLPFHRPDR